MSYKKDLAVIAKFMGWKKGKDGKYRSGPVIGYEQVRDPFVNISDAFDVAASIMVDTTRYGSYPFVLREDRYGGTYSGGDWLASFGAERYEWDAALGDDTTASDYWCQPAGERKIRSGKSDSETVALAAAEYLRRKAR